MPTDDRRGRGPHGTADAVCARGVALRPIEWETGRGPSATPAGPTRPRPSSADANDPMSLSRIRVNGADRDVVSEPDAPLLYVLRNELSLNGPKFGCGLGQCGACTVHVDGAPRRSCVTAVSAVVGKEVVTLEGLGTPERPHPLQQAFIDEQAAQCGYCVNGMIMRAAALLARTPHPTRDEITTALSANLCRCGTHMRIVRAIARAAEGSASAPAGRDG
jgi:nicotinate dehydrogenase subunit A